MNIIAIATWDAIESPMPHAAAQPEHLREAAREAAAQAALAREQEAMRQHEEQHAQAPELALLARQPWRFCGAGI